MESWIGGKVPDVRCKERGYEYVMKRVSVSCCGTEFVTSHWGILMHDSILSGGMGRSRLWVARKGLGLSGARTRSLGDWSGK